jgi:hypothetical protein
MLSKIKIKIKIKIKNQYGSRDNYSKGIDRNHKQLVSILTHRISKQYW